ncbi:MAG: PKD domain-containing protein, partial [Thermoplasmata archaeon]|nr:PKD domain-containing protein [Thermoplasmata archaeon]
YSWDIGDGNITDWSTNSGAEHAYLCEDEYDVILYVKDDNGVIIASESIEVEVENVVPEVKGTASSFEVNEGEEISFAVTETEDTASDLPFIRYEWNFKDGSGKFEGAEVNHTYYKSNDYEVELTIYDDDNAKSTYTLKTIAVKNFPPEASFSIDKTDVEVNTKVYFTAWNSTDSPWELENLRFFWKFGDGKSGNGMNVSHVYRNAGEYEVELTVFDDDEETATYIDYVNVIEPASASDKREGGLDMVWIAGIAGVVVLIILILIAFLLMRKRKQESGEPEKPGEGEPQVPPMPPPLFPPPGAGMPPFPFPPPSPEMLRALGQGQAPPQTPTVKPPTVVKSTSHDESELDEEE